MNDRAARSSRSVDLVCGEKGTPGLRPWDSLTASDAFFVARIEDGQLRIQGNPTYFRGNKYKDASGQESYEHFIEWNWDGQTLIARNDRFGFRPLYIAYDSKFIAVSESLPRLLQAGVGGAFDDEAMSVFFRLGWFVGHRTPVKDVRVLPPGSSLRWSFGTSSLTEGEYPFPVSCESTDRKKLVDRYVELFRHAVAQRLPNGESSAVPISGGADSRHILLELDRQGSQPDFCLTIKRHVGKGDHDRLVAQELTRKLKLQHLVIDDFKSWNWRRREYEHNILTGFSCAEHSWYVAARTILQNADVVYDGIAGDVLSSGLFLSEKRLQQYGSMSYEAFADSLLDRPEAKIESLLGDVLYGRWNRETALEMIADQLKRHAEMPNPVGSFFFWNRTRRTIAMVPFGILRRVKTVHCPYLDPELFAFLTSLPASFLLDKSFHRDAIARGYPKYATLPYSSNSGNRSTVRERMTTRATAAEALFASLRGSLSGDIASDFQRIAPVLLKSAISGSSRCLSHVRVAQYLGQVRASLQHTPWVG